MESRYPEFQPISQADVCSGSVLLGMLRFPPQALINVGFTTGQLRDAGVSAIGLRKAGFSLQDLRSDTVGSLQ